MLELGTKSEKLHKNLSRVINSDIDKVFIKGLETLVTYKNISKKTWKYFTARWGYRFYFESNYG